MDKYIFKIEKERIWKHENLEWEGGEGEWEREMAMLFGLYGGVVGVLKNSAASVLFGIAIMCQALCQLLYM